MTDPLSTGSPPDRPPAKRNNAAVAVACFGLVAGMVGAAYAAVPIYRLFCQVTGYGGTTQRADEGPGRVIDRAFTVSFDANVRDGLPWRFEPEVRQLRVKAGEVVEVRFRAVNESDRETVGTSTFNVTPGLMGSYFSKIQCFCFTEQTLKPGESLEMPVVFYVDPAVTEDHELDSVKAITLSYSFFPVKAATPLAAATPEAQPDKKSVN